MAEKTGFIPDVDYTSQYLASWVRSFIGNGVYSTELPVTAIANGGMTVKVPAGKAWINGYFYTLDADMTLTIDAADGVLNRKDIIVLRLTTNSTINIAVVKGTPASTAVAPTITRNSSYYDIELAEISIPAGATAIPQSSITDKRLDSAVCGTVSAVIQQLDFSTALAQLTAQFNTWFDEMKGQLSTDAAGNLQNEIDAETARATAAEALLASLSSFNFVDVNGVRTLKVGNLQIMYSSSGPTTGATYGDFNIYFPNNPFADTNYAASIIANGGTYFIPQINKKYVNRLELIARKSDGGQLLNTEIGFTWLLIGKI